MKANKSRDKLYKEQITFAGTGENLNEAEMPEPAEFSFVQGKEVTDQANKTGDQFTDKRVILTDDQVEHLEKANST